MSQYAEQREVLIDGDAWKLDVRPVNVAAHQGQLPNWSATAIPAEGPDVHLGRFSTPEQAWEALRRFHPDNT